MTKGEQPHKSEEFRKKPVNCWKAIYKILAYCSMNWHSCKSDELQKKPACLQFEWSLHFWIPEPDCDNEQFHVFWGTRVWWLGCPEERLVSSITELNGRCIQKTDWTPVLCSVPPSPSPKPTPWVFSLNFFHIKELGLTTLLVLCYNINRALFFHPCKPI